MKKDYFCIRSSLSYSSDWKGPQGAQKYCLPWTSESQGNFCRVGYSSCVIAQHCFFLGPGLCIIHSIVIRFLFAYSVNLSRTLSIIILPAVLTKLYSFENMTWVFAMSSSRLLIKMPDRIGSRINSCSITLTLVSR